MVQERKQVAALLGQTCHEACRVFVLDGRVVQEDVVALFFELSTLAAVLLGLGLSLLLVHVNGLFEASGCLGEER